MFGEVNGCVINGVNVSLTIDGSGPGVALLAVHNGTTVVGQTCLTAHGPSCFVAVTVGINSCSSTVCVVLCVHTQLLVGTDW